MYICFMAQDPLPLILINARKRSLLTQAQVASRAGTTQSAIARYEKGTLSPSVDTLKRLLKANGFDLVIDVKPTRKIAARSALYKKIQSNRGEIRSILHAVGATNIRLFGSVARGEDGKGSDVDILVDINPESGMSMNAVSCGRSISKILGVKVDVAPSHMLKKEVLKSALHDSIPL